jgi:hypothetical protein
MNVTQLRSALDVDGIRREIVLASLARRRTVRRRVRLGMAGGAAAVVAVVVVGIALAGRGPGAADNPASPSPPPLASGCAGVPLRTQLQRAAGTGQSVIEAVGRLTGRSATAGGARYLQMSLTDVRMISGARLPSTTTGWLPAGGPSSAAGGGAPTLWGPDGHLVAFVTPAGVAGTGLGPMLRTAPVVGADVILSSAGCWTTDGLITTGYTGPLQEIPGSGSIEATRQAGGFRAYPLAKFQQLATG